MNQLFPGVLLLASLGLLAWHLRAWREVGRAAGLAEAERDFRRRQLYRRLVGSSLLLVLALVTGVGSFVPWRDSPRLFLWTWSIAGWLAMALVVVAGLDLWDSRGQWSQLVRERDEARRNLEGELSRLRERARARPGTDLGAETSPAGSVAEARRPPVA